MRVFVEIICVALAREAILIGLASFASLIEVGAAGAFVIVKVVLVGDTAEAILRVRT